MIQRETFQVIKRIKGLAIRVDFKDAILKSIEISLLSAALFIWMNHCIIIVPDTLSSLLDTSRQGSERKEKKNEIIITVSKRTSVQICVCIHSSLTRNFPWHVTPLLLTERNAAFALEKIFPEFFKYSLDYHSEHRSLENCVRQERVNINCDFVPDSAIEFLFLSPVKVCRRAWRPMECLKRCAFIERGRKHNTGHEIDCDPSIWTVFKYVRAFAQARL